MIENCNINIAKLPQGDFEKRFFCDSTFFQKQQSPGIIDGNIEIQLHVRHIADQYLMTLSLAGNVLVPCDRCLDPVELPINTQLKLNIRFGEDYDDSHDGILIIPQNMTTLDLAPIISDTVVLEVPLRTVHPEGKCNPEMLQILMQHRVEIPHDDAEENNDDNI